MTDVVLIQSCVLGGPHETTYTLKLVTLLKPYLCRLMFLDRHTREPRCGFRCAESFKQPVRYSNSITLYLPLNLTATSKYAGLLELRFPWLQTNAHVKVKCGYLETENKVLRAGEYLGS